jgi:hypothetical protein
MGRDRPAPIPTEAPRPKLKTPESASWPDGAHALERQRPRHHGVRPEQWRGLVFIAAGKKKCGIFFIPYKGKRFMTLGECPWDKGK